MVRTYDLNGNKQIYRVESHARERDSMTFGEKEDSWKWTYLGVPNIPILESVGLRRSEVR